MSKVITNTGGTQFDPFASEQDIFKSLGLQPKVNKPIVDSPTQGALRETSSLDVRNLYDSDATAMSVDSLTKQQDAVDESSLSGNLLKGLGRIGTKVVAEVLKTPGYIGGGANALVQEGLNAAGITEDNPDGMALFVDNAWVNAFEQFDQAMKDAMPVTVAKDVQEGGMLGKLADSAWWASTGADGIGFLLSMFVPGKALAAAGVGTKLTRAALKTMPSVLEATGAATRVGEGLMATNKFANGVNGSLSMVTNSVIESAAESAGTFDNMKAKYLRENPEASEGEANQYAGSAAANVFKANLPLLLVSNLIDEITLFKSFGDDAVRKAASKEFRAAVKDGVVMEGKNIAKAGLKQRVIGIGSAVGKAFAKEGLFEEGLQFEVQQHEEGGRGQGKSYGQDVFGDYFSDLWSSPEMMESVVLGGILGGGMSALSANAEVNDYNETLFGRAAKENGMFRKFFQMPERKERKGLVNLLNENLINNFKTINDVAKKDAKGKPLTDKDGKVEIDTDLLKRFSQEQQNLILMNHAYDNALATGENLEADHYSDLMAFNYMLPYIKEEGGRMILQQHIDNQLLDKYSNRFKENSGRDMTTEEKDALKEKLTKQANTFSKIYETIDNTHNPALYVKKGDGKAEDYKAWSNDTYNKKLQLLMLEQTNINYENKIKNDLLKEGLSSTSTEGMDLDKLTSAQKHALAIAKVEEARLQRSQKEVKDGYETLFTKKGMQEDYDNFTKLKEEEALKESEEVAKAAMSNAITNEKSFFDKANEEGYLSEETEKGYKLTETHITVQDRSGNRGILYRNKLEEEVPVWTFITKNGKPIVVSENGRLKESFLKQNYIPIGKAKLADEQKALRIKTHRESQLKVLNEILTYRVKAKAENEKYLEELKVKTEKLKFQIDDLYQQLDDYTIKKVGSKIFKHPKKSKILLKKAQIESLILDAEIYLEELNKSKAKAEYLINRFGALIEATKTIQKAIQDNPDAVSLNEAKPKLQKMLLDSIEQYEKQYDKNYTFENDIIELQSSIEQLQEQDRKISIEVDRLWKLKNKLLDIKMKNEVLFNIAAGSTIKQWKEGKFKNEAGEFLRNVENLFKEQGGKWLRQDLEDNYFRYMEGERTFLNNLDARANALVEYYSTVGFEKLYLANPDFRKFMYDRSKLSITDMATKIYSMPFTVEDLYAYVHQGVIDTDILLGEMISSGTTITPERANEIRNELEATNKDLGDLQRELGEVRAVLKNKLTERNLFAIDELLDKKVMDRFKAIRKQAEYDNLEPNQVNEDKVDTDNPITAEQQVSLYDEFINKTLPETPFVTTGLNVLYDSSGNDKIDTATGLPLLNESPFQQTWFNFLDKVDDISEYLLLPVRAYYADNIDELQDAINVGNINNRRDKDNFVFITDKTGKAIRVDGNGNIISTGGSLVFTSLATVEMRFPSDKPLPKLQIKPLVNSYLESIGIKTILGIKNDTDKLVDLFGRKAESDIIVSTFGENATYKDLVNAAIAKSKKEYQDFLDSIPGSEVGDRYLQPITVGRGKFIYKRDKDGNVVKTKVAKTFDIKFKEKTIGLNQVGDVKIGVITPANTTVTSQGEQFALPLGSTYIQTGKDFAIVEQRMINPEEAVTVMALLSLAFNQTGLNTVTVPMPTKQDGTSYYYFINGRKIEKNINVFSLNKAGSDAASFSLISTLINYGYKKNNPKGSIFIEKGNVVFNTFDDVEGRVPLSEVNNFINTGIVTEGTQALYNFLLTKRYNVDRSLIKDNPVYLRPIYNPSTKSFDFDTKNTYYKYMLENVLETTVTRAKGYPLKVQRNIKFSPDYVKPLSENVKKAVQEPAVVPEATTPVSTTELSAFEKNSIEDILKLATDRIGLKSDEQLAAGITLDTVKQNPAFVADKDKLTEAFYTTIHKELNDLFKDELTRRKGEVNTLESENANLVQRILNGEDSKIILKGLPIQRRIDIETMVKESTRLEAETTVVETAEPIIQETPAVEDDPFADLGDIDTTVSNIASTSADKIVNPRILLESLIQSKQITKDCR